MKTLRLLLFSDCNRNCPGCCNKDWDLKALPICTSFKEYDEIILTGGEPMLHSNLVIQTVQKIREENPTAKVFMYTAKVDSIEIVKVLDTLDGLTLTFHEQEDVESFLPLHYEVLCWPPQYQKSLRLNVFSGIDISSLNLRRWKVKRGIEWIKNCPLPQNEIFMRLN